ncbi:MAG: response regulator [Burkholderiales bacterium]
MTAEPKILVATEVSSDADLVRGLLREEFGNVVASSDPERAVQDFEEHRPEVLILAFNSLEKAERYYLGLYRLSTVVHALPHRTLILCNKNDLRRVYELCRKEYFDDYILFWPLTHDTPRLPMAVHHAVRQMTAAAMPGGSEIAAQARRLADLESQLERYAAKGGQHMEAARSSLRQAGQDIGAALDSFSRKLSHGGYPDLVDVKDRDGLQREIKRLKAEEIEKPFQTVAAAVQPVQQWASALKDDLAPQLESARALQSLAEHFRPLVLVVDDDEFQHKLLKQTLAEMDIDLVFTTSGMEALASLRKRRPDLILMDVGLPDIDGVETTRRLKSVEQFANIPVVMITGHSEKAVVVESLKAGAADFAVKPFDKEVLLAKVRNFLNLAPT